MWTKVTIKREYFDCCSSFFFLCAWANNEQEGGKDGEKERERRKEIKQNFNELK